jgi:hypothetical protein
MRALSPDTGRQGDRAPQAASEPLPQPSEMLLRDTLEEMARAEDIEEGEITAAPNKTTLIKLITDHRAAGIEPEVDPSANL